MSKNIRLYDFKKKTVSEMPAAELSAEVVRVTIAGVPGEVYAYMKDLKPGKPRRGGKSLEKWLPQIKAIKKTFDEFYPKSMKEWVDGFRADSHPEQEIRAWVQMAVCYDMAIERTGGSKAERKEVFNLVLRQSMGGTDEEILAQCQVPKLGKARAWELLQIWREGPKGKDWGK